MGKHASGHQNFRLDALNITQPSLSPELSNQSMKVWSFENFIFIWVVWFAFSRPRFNTQYPIPAPAAASLESETEETYKTPMASTRGLVAPRRKIPLLGATFFYLNMDISLLKAPIYLKI